MKRRSKLMEAKRAAHVEASRQMTAEQRLAAYAEHSRLVMEVYKAGQAYRASRRRPNGQTA